MSDVREKTSKAVCHLENRAILSFGGEEDGVTLADNQLTRGIHQADVKASYKWSACH